MKKFSLLLMLCILALTTYAQNFTYGNVDSEDYNFDKNKIDSNANAVVLKEFGAARLQLDDATGQLMLLFEYHVKIKIYNKEGFNEANIFIPKQKNGDRQEYVQDIAAVTYNMVNGSLVSTEMDRKAIFDENKSKYLSITKFTLPNIKEGSVIEIITIT